MEVPKSLKEGFREIMSADPVVVDLHKMGPYYYEFARHLMKLTPAEGEAIGKSITQTFTRRFRSIMDQSENSSDTDTIKVCWRKEMVNIYLLVICYQVTSKMDNLERMLFREGRNTNRGMNDWLERRTGVISTSSMVARHRKRKANFD